MSDTELMRGLERQLETRAGLLADGAKPLGWKAGFGAPEWLSKFGLGGPLVGFLTDASVIPDGATVDISKWTRAVAEPELAVRLGANLEPPFDVETTRAAISMIGPAIELADIDPPPDSVEAILTGNIFHRGVILGQPDPTRAGGDLTGLEATIRLEGQDEFRTDELETVTGRVVYVITHLASLLATGGERIRSGEIVICGSVVPPIALSPSTKVEFELPPAPAISIQTAP